jgi:hypothetical protein
MASCSPRNPAIARAPHVAQLTARCAFSLQAGPLKDAGGEWSIFAFSTEMKKKKNNRIASQTHTSETKKFTMPEVFIPSKTRTFR